MRVGILAGAVLVVWVLAMPSADCAFSGVGARADSGAEQHLGQRFDVGIVIVHVGWVDAWLGEVAAFFGMVGLDGYEGLESAAGWVTGGQGRGGHGNEAGLGVQVNAWHLDGLLGADVAGAAGLGLERHPAHGSARGIHMLGGLGGGEG